MGLMSMFPGGGGTNNQPLKAPTNFVVAAGGQTSLHLTWTDPENEYSQPSGALIGEWMFTRIVRKAGSAPVNANDGVLVVESGAKNQYQTTPYVDSGLIRGTVYYYAAFAFTKARVSSPGAFAEYHLKGYDAILQNNTWDVIALAVSEGEASSIWSKGDTKTETVSGIEMTFEILAFEDQNIVKLTEDTNKKPAIIFGTKYVVSTDVEGYYQAENNSTRARYTYAGSTLESRLTAYYNNMPDLLKKHVQRCHWGPVHEWEYSKTHHSYTSSSTYYDSYLMAFVHSTMNAIYPSTASRIKRYRNADGEPYDWILAGMGVKYNYMPSGNYSTTHYPYFVTKEGITETDGEHSTPPEYKGCAFMFGFGKAGG